MSFLDNFKNSNFNEVIGFSVWMQDRLISLQHTIMVMSEDNIAPLIESQWPGSRRHLAKSITFSAIMSEAESGDTIYFDKESKVKFEKLLYDIGLGHHLSDESKIIYLKNKAIEIYPFTSSFIFMPPSSTKNNNLKNKVIMPSLPYGALYERKFYEAISRTSKVGLKKHTFKKRKGSIIRKVMDFINIRIRKCGLEDIAFKCNVLSQQIVDILKKELNVNSYMTIGTIWQGGEDVFSSANIFDEKFIKSVIEKGCVPENYSHHAWVTLETMEIIDYTLDASRKLVSTSPREEGYEITASHPNEITDKCYVPVLIGDEFYSTYDSKKYKLAQAIETPYFERNVIHL